MGKTAIVLGATGLTGNALVRKLLIDSRYDCLKIFGRRSTGIANSKIREYVIDLFEMERYKKEFTADEVYCCIGTTAAKSPDQRIYRKIDYGIPVMAAQLCKRNGITTLVVISALGANKNSRIFYNRIKGEMEEKIQSFQIAKTHMLQPSLIGGKRNEKRFGEQLAKTLFSRFDFLLIGPLKKYKMIEPESIATAMIWLANNPYESGKITSQNIQKIADHLAWK